jgi:hypothetical protein
MHQKAGLQTFANRTPTAARILRDVIVSATFPDPSSFISSLIFYLDISMLI